METERFEDLLDEFTSDADIEAAKREEEAGESDARRPSGEIIKDYPGVQRSCDLHGLTKEKAYTRINEFIYSAQRDGLKTLRIISGEGSGIIKKFTNTLLTHLKHDGVILDFKPEKRTASFIVYLK